MAAYKSNKKQASELEGIIDSLKDTKEYDRVLKALEDSIKKYGRTKYEIEKSLFKPFSSHHYREEQAAILKMTNALKEINNIDVNLGKKFGIDDGAEIDELAERYKKLKNVISQIAEAKKLASEGKMDMKQADDMVKRLERQKKFIESNTSGLDVGGVRALAEIRNGQENETTKALERQLELKKASKNGEKEYERARERTALAEEKNAKRMESISAAWGKISQIGGDFISIIKQTVMYAAEWEDSAYKTGRAIGFSTNQTKAYLNDMAKDIGDFGFKYGMSDEEIEKWEGRIVQATGKAIVMSHEQKDAFAAASKTFGDEVVDGMIASMDNMGGSILEATSNLAKAQIGARRLGIDASKYAKDFADNLSWAQKNVSFKNGTDGIRRMTELSEVLKVNMQGIIQAADKMGTVQGSIESSAKLQMLGGRFAMNFSDPMRAMYQSQSDPEALFKTIVDSVKGMSTFDKENGMATTNWQGRQMLKAAAEASGANYDDLLQASQSQAKLQFMGSMMNPNLTEDEKLSVANRAQRGSNGQYYVDYYNDATGKHEQKNINSLTSSDVKNMTARAEQEKDLNGNVQKITDFLGKDIKDTLTGYVSLAKSTLFPTGFGIAHSIVNVANKIYNFLLQLPEKVKSWLLPALAALIIAPSASMGILKMVGKGVWNLGKGIGHIGTQLFTGHGFGMEGAEKSAEAGSKIIGAEREVASGKEIANGVKALEETESATKSSSFLGKLGIKNFSSLSKLGKGLRIGGAAAGALQAAYGITQIYSGAEDEDNQEANLAQMRNNRSLQDTAALNGGYSPIESNMARIAAANQKKSMGIADTIGGTALAAGSFYGPIGLAVGGLIDAASHFAAHAFSKKASDVTYEEQAKDRANTYWFETSKFGEKAVNSQRDIVSQAIIKTCDIAASIYQLLASTGKDKNLNKALTSKLNKSAGIEDDKFEWYNPFTWFSNGGVVPDTFANGGYAVAKNKSGYYPTNSSINPYEGDNVITRVNAGEIILNTHEQDTIKRLMPRGTKVKPNDNQYEKVTFVSHKIPEKSSSKSESMRQNTGKFDINISGTINLNANGHKVDLKELINDPSFKRELVGMITRQASKNYEGKYNPSPSNRMGSGNNYRAWV